MRFTDLLQLAFANLRRNQVRSLMTLAGVMIGVAALMALLAYGAGLQQNARQEFDALALYNTLRVTSAPNPFTSLAELSARPRIRATDTLPQLPLTDTLIRSFERIPGVLAAYPEVIFPAVIAFEDREVVVNAEGIPMVFRDIPAYQPAYGRFFTAETDSSLLLSTSMARRLGFERPEDAVGRRVDFKTATLNFRALQAAALSFGLGLRSLPLDEKIHPLRISGLLPDEDQPVSGFVRVLVPLALAETMQKITFFSTIDLLMRRSNLNGYSAVRVQLARPEAMTDVQTALEARGVYVTSFRDQFEQLGRLFRLLDLALGVIGFIALLVATLGIANTMLMSVMERYREIGVMKAIGGDETDLQKLFLLESGLIGLAGGLLGLAFGWGIIQLVSGVVNYYLYRQGVAEIDLFYTSPVLLLGVLGTALLISLLAGVAPARKAARIEPIQALRHG